MLRAGTGIGTAELAAVLHAPDGWPEIDLEAGVRAARAYATAIPA